MIKTIIITDYVESINGLKSVCPLCVKSRQLSRNNATRDQYMHAQAQCKRGLLTGICEWIPALFLDLRIKDKNEEIRLQLTELDLRQVFGEVKTVLKNLISLMCAPPTFMW